MHRSTQSLHNIEIFSPCSSRNDGQDRAAAAAVTAVDGDDEPTTMKGDDEVQIQGKRKRTTSNKEIYDQFTDASYEKYSVLLFLVLIIHVYSGTS
jgi:hypothetical protein